MKAENMKLPDLQTGKYLELGKDFYYGCNTIMLHCYTKEELTEYQQRDDYNPHYLIYDTDYNNPEKYHKIIHNGFQEAIDRDTATVRLFTEHKSEPQGILKTLCDKTGALVYGGRYVLIKTFEYLNKEIKVGDIITAKTLTTSKDSISIKQHTNQIVCFRDNTAFEHSGYNMGFVICENLKCFGINGFWKHRPFDYEERQLEITGNLFEESSKQLRNEENKFAELTEKLK